jgi:hypothetical protein
MREGTALISIRARVAELAAHEDVMRRQLSEALGNCIRNENWPALSRLCGRPMEVRGGVLIVGPIDRDV